MTREALRTQSPQAVLIEGTSLFFNTYQNYTQINVGYMPFSLNKLGAIFTASEPELRSGLLFDLYFYHTRWKEVALSGVKRALTPAHPDHYKGYTAAGGHGCRPLCGGPERGPAGLRRKPGVAGYNSHPLLRRTAFSPSWPSAPPTPAVSGRLTRALRRRCGPWTQTCGFITGVRS